MKLKTFLIIAAAASALYGIIVLFLPGFVMQTNGLDVSESAKVFAESVGGLFLGIGLINFYARNDTGSNTLKGVLMGNIVVHAMALVTDGAAVLTNVISQNQWFSILVHVIFLIGFVYYFLRFRKIS